MRIDFHTHAFPRDIAARAIAKLQAAADTPAFVQGTYESLSQSTVQAGLNLSIVLPVATHPKQVARINQTAAQINRGTGASRLFSFGGIHPDTPDYKDVLRRIQGEGMKGVKLHPPYQGVAFDDFRYLRIVEYASRLGLIVLVHAGTDIGIPAPELCTVEQICRVLEQVQPERLVLAHMGGWMCWDQVEERLCGRPLYLDTSLSLGSVRQGRLPLLSPEQFVRMVRRHGADRVLFGTDSPWSSQSQAVSELCALPLTPRELELILGGSGQQLLAQCS